MGMTTRSTSTALRKYKLNERFFDDIDSEAKAYWLGFLLADGTIATTGRNRRAYQLRCTLQERDITHLELLRGYLDSEHPIRLDSLRKAAILAITSFRLISPLLDMGWVEFKRYGCIRILEDVPEILKRHLIRGLMDGDGTIGVYGRRWTLSFVDLNLQIVEWVQSWLMRTFDLRKTKIQHPSKAYSFQYNGNTQVPPIIEGIWGNSSISLERKLTIAQSAFPSAETLKLS